MEEALREVNSVVGVMGCFVCDLDGRILAAEPAGTWEPSTLAIAGRTAAQTMAGLQIARRRKPGDLDLLFDNGRLLVKNLGVGCLCLLCTPRINVPLVSLRAGIASRKLTSVLRGAPGDAGAGRSKASDRHAREGDDKRGRSRGGLNGFLRPFDR